MGLTTTLEREGVEVNKPLLSLQKGLTSSNSMVRQAAEIAEKRSVEFTDGYISHSDGSDWDDYNVD